MLPKKEFYSSVSDWRELQRKWSERRFCENLRNNAKPGLWNFQNDCESSSENVNEKLKRELMEKKKIGRMSLDLDWLI